MIKKKYNNYTEVWKMTKTELQDLVDKDNDLTIKICGHEVYTSQLKKYLNLTAKGLMVETIIPKDGGQTNMLNSH
jgi:hypothetical protein